MKKFLAAAIVIAASAAAHAQTTVTEAWARATMPQQKATAVFGKIVSPTGGKVVAVSSPVAGVAEVHEMKMEGDTMKMRAIEGGLVLPAGQPVVLAPRSTHVMLMDLNRSLADGETLPLTLVIEGAGGKRETLTLQVPVKADMGMGHGEGHGAMHKH